MGKKSRRNRQKNPEAFKKSQQNAAKKEKMECWCKRRTQGEITSPFAPRNASWSGGFIVKETGEPLHDPRRYT